MLRTARSAMHVAFVIDNLGSGGAQRQVAEIAVRLHRDAGVGVSVAIYRRIEFFRPRLEDAGIAVETLPKRGPVDPGFARRLRAWVRREGADVVHVFLPAPVVWGALARGRGPGPAWIAAERSLPSENLSPLWRALLRRAYARYDAFTVNCHPAARELEETFGLPADRVHYVPNGIDLAAWDRRAAEEPPFALEAGRFHLALVGRMTEEKNHALLLDALLRLGPEPRRDLRVWFVGASDEFRRDVARVARAVEARGLGDCVRMVPPTPALPALMRVLDAIVLPSRFEGFPNVVMEAMATRLPVLASAVGDVPFMVEDGVSGHVVPPGDAAALAAGLARLLAMTPEARAAMGAAARAAVEARYRLEVVAERHLDLYRRLAGGLRSDAGAPGLG